MGDKRGLGQGIIQPVDYQRRCELLAQVQRRIRGQDSISRLTLEQLEFVVHPLTCGCFLSACPGSGKTECVGYKLAYEAAAWNSRGSGIAVVTFTRNAAEEIRSRAASLSGRGVRHPHFVGTFDSWLHSYLIQPFGHIPMAFPGRNGDHSIRLLDEGNHSPFLNNYEVSDWIDGLRKVYRVVDFSLDANGSPLMKRGAIGNASVRERLVAAKLAFAAAGYATYDDAIAWALLLLNKSSLARLLAARFPFILVDECQDLSATQLELLNRLCALGVVCHFVGDLHQAIYGFRDVNPTAVDEHSSKNSLARRALTENFRSSQPIVDFARTLVGAAKATGRKCRDDHLQCLLWQYENDSKSELPGQFAALVKSRGFNVGACAVVARGTSTLERLLGGETLVVGDAFDSARALQLWHSPERSGAHLVEAVDLMGRVLCRLAYDGCGQLSRQWCPNDLEPTRWRSVVHEFLRSGATAACFVSKGKALPWSDWVRIRLKPFMESNWSLLPDSHADWADIAGRLRAPDGLTKRSVEDSSAGSRKGSVVRVTTIHKVKGQTLDALLLVSSRDKRSPGGHIEHWLEDPASEYARFAYVACTRPRHLIIIATPRLERGLVQELVNRGLALDVPPTIT